MSVIASFQNAVAYPSAVYAPLDSLDLNAANFLTGQNEFQGETLLDAFDITTVSDNSAVTVATLGDALAQAALLFADNNFTATMRFEQMKTPYSVNDEDVGTLGYLNDQIKGKNAATLAGTQTFVAANDFQNGVGASSLTTTNLTATVATFADATATTLNITGAGSTANTISVQNVTSNGALLYGWPQGGPYWFQSNNQSSGFVGASSAAPNATSGNISFYYVYNHYGTSTSEQTVYLPTADAHLGQVVKIFNSAAASCRIYVDAAAKIMLNNWAQLSQYYLLKIGNSVTFVFIGNTPISTGGSALTWFMIDQSDGN